MNKVPRGVILMQEDKHYRHELKYAVSYGDHLAIRSRLSKIMSQDPHVSGNGRYLIRSIYFDNTDDKVLRDKINGIGKREKFRIRYYNDDLSFISLEKKMKIGNLSLKYSSQITEEELRKILGGDISFLKESKDDLLMEFYSKMKFQRLRPRVLVSYIREPYIYKAGNVRITFDSDIRTSLYDNSFLSNINNISASDQPGDMLMEVKYDAFLPEIIQDIIQTPAIRQQAFSKYGACRRFG